MIPCCNQQALISKDQSLLSCRHLVPEILPPNVHLTKDDIRMLLTHTASHTLHFEVPERVGQLRMKRSRDDFPLQCAPRQHENGPLTFGVLRSRCTMRLECR